MSELMTPAAKVELVQEYLVRYPRDAWVETGLWRGVGTTMRLLDRWPDLWPQRLALLDWEGENCRLAREWADAASPLGAKVDVILGDSAVTLGAWLDELRTPAFFWLDAHHHDAVAGVASCPLREELEAIARHPYAGRHVVLIDDARMILDDWPGFPTFAEVRHLARDLWDIAEQADVVRLTPKLRRTRLA